MLIGSLDDLKYYKDQLVFVVRQHAHERSGHKVWTSRCSIDECIAGHPSNDPFFDLTTCFGSEDEIGMTAIFTTRQSAEDHQVMVALYADFDTDDLPEAANASGACFNGSPNIVVLDQARYYRAPVQQQRHPFPPFSNIVAHG